MEIANIPDEDARDLMARGLVQLPPPPQVVYETKIVAPEVKPVAALPFRDVHHADDGGTTEVHPASDPLLSAADMAEPGTAHPRRRGRGRPRKYPR